MNWIWGSGGNALFDYYSINHFGWFVAITLIIYPLLRKKTLIGVFSVMIFWEIVEIVIDKYTDFPLAGKEQFINKVIGDPISNLLGFMLAMFLIKIIEKGVKNG